MKAYLMVGQVLKPQGIKGEIKVLPSLDDPADICEFDTLYLDEKGERAVQVEDARMREGCAYLQLAGVEDRDSADALRGALLYIDRASAAPLPEGRYYISDLIGMAVSDESGAKLGTLTDVMQAGGNDVYEVKGARTFRFPALKRVLACVDVSKGAMTLDSAALAEIAVYDDAD